MVIKMLRYGQRLSIGLSVISVTLANIKFISFKMIPQENQNNTIHPMHDNDSADIKKFVFKILRNWYWFVLAVMLTGGLAYTYVRYTTPIYEVSTTMLFEDPYMSSNTLSAGSGAMGDVFQGLGGMGSMQNIYNQMEILKSTPVVSKTINELNFEVSYFNVGRVKVSEAYKKFLSR